MINNDLNPNIFQLKNLSFLNAFWRRKIFYLIQKVSTQTAKLSYPFMHTNPILFMGISYY